jgi:HSP20 family molecular chaperone IbpA
MIFGGDDAFSDIESLFSQLAGRRTPTQRRNPSSQSLLNTVESKKETILIFELPGKKISSVTIENESVINEYGEKVHTKDKVLKIKTSENTIQYNITKDLVKRKIDYKFTNGILEVYLRK